MIGERLSELRKDAGLTQDQLAEILRINKHSISSYERDKSEPPDVIKIAAAKYFGVSVDYLLGLTPYTEMFEPGADYLKLPPGLSTEDKETLKSYADFLAYKNNIKQTS